MDRRIMLMFLMGTLGIIVGCSAVPQNPPPAPVVIREARLPVPSPVLECSPLKDGMVVSIGILDEREILLTLEGFEPGESIWFRYQTENRRMGTMFSMESRPLATVDEMGRFVTRERLPTREQHGNGEWDVRIAHNRGVACTQVAMP
jgi:hypothetical protein